MTKSLAGFFRYLTNVIYGIPINGDETDMNMEKKSAEKAEEVETEGWSG